MTDIWHCKPDKYLSKGCIFLPMTSSKIPAVFKAIFFSELALLTKLDFRLEQYGKDSKASTTTFQHPALKGTHKA